MNKGRVINNMGGVRVDVFKIMKDSIRNLNGIPSKRAIFSSKIQKVISLPTNNSVLLKTFCILVTKCYPIYPRLHLPKLFFLFENVKQFRLKIFFENKMLR